MNDAARHFDRAQVLQQQVRRAPDVHDHRQTEVARDLQLLAIEPLLPLRIEPGFAGFEQIDADLADRDEARIGSAAGTIARSRSMSAGSASASHSGWMPSA